MRRVRKYNRLQKYDYSQNGIYYVTICTHNKKHYFGVIRNDQMILNRCGKIIEKQWHWLEKQYYYIQLDKWVIMPNHIHGILIINNRVVSPRSDRSRPDTTKIKPLSELIGAFKTISSKYIHKIGLINFQWQRSYYDHVIRNERSLEKVREYILFNPSNWKKDKFKIESINKKLI